MTKVCFCCAQGKPKRSFVQTFFLAVQEKGYFVLNDLFRYLPEPQPVQPPQLGVAPAPVSAAEEGVHEAAPAPAAQHAPQMQACAALIAVC